MTVISVVVVTHNNHGTIRACLEPLLSCSYIHLVVLENASTDNCLAEINRLTSERDQCTIIISHRNLGFARGVNEAIQHTDSEFIVLLNPDAIASCDSLARLVAFLEEHPDVGIVAPTVRSNDGSIQLTFGPLPTLLSVVGSTLGVRSRLAALLETVPLLGTPLRPWLASAGHAVEGSEVCQVRDVATVSGVCLATSKRVFQDVGPFDERFFMYLEDVDWSKRVREAGWRIVRLPHVGIQHASGHSFRQAYPNAEYRISSLRLRSLLAYFAKHGRHIDVIVIRVAFSIVLLGHLLVALTSRQGKAHGDIVKALALAVRGR